MSTPINSSMDEVTELKEIINEKTAEICNLQEEIRELKKTIDDLHISIQMREGISIDDISQAKRNAKSLGDIAAMYLTMVADDNPLNMPKYAECLGKMFEGTNAFEVKTRRNTYFKVPDTTDDVPPPKKGTKKYRESIGLYTEIDPSLPQEDNVIDLVVRKFIPRRSPI